MFLFAAPRGIDRSMLGQRLRRGLRLRPDRHATQALTHWQLTTRRRILVSCNMAPTWEAGTHLADPGALLATAALSQG